MKYSKKIRGMSTALAFAFAFMVFSFSFAPKAYATEFNGNITIGWKYDSNEGYSYRTENFAAPVVNGFVPTSTSYSMLWSNNNGLGYGDITFNTEPTTLFYDEVKLYLSYFLVRAGGGTNIIVTDGYTDPSTFTVSYINTNGQTGYVEGGLDSISTFSSAAGVGGVGYAIEASWSGSELLPIRALQFSRSNIKIGYRNLSSNSGVNGNVSIPSCRIITTQTSQEMEALNNVASEIAAQSDILLAMKGDIVAILQDIYTMTGDIHIAQNLLNSYIAQMLPLLQSIDQTTTNIYALLSSQLAALETAINTTATTIEAAIEAQTAAMIAYLEEMFNTGNEVPSDTYEQQQDAENILDQMESLEKPDVETIVPEIDDYSDGGVSGVMSAIFSSNLIVTMMTLSASLAFGAYVLFGKRS